jgi:integrase
MNLRGKRPKQVLTLEEIHALLEVVTRGDLGARNKALIFTLWRTGVRVSEICRLRPSDVDLMDGTLRVLASKRGRSRTIGLDGETVGQIALWATRRTARSINGQCPLFCSLTGDRLTPNAVRELLNRLASKAGLNRHVKPNDLRATFASVAARQVPLPDLSNALGHSDLAVTSRYIADLGGKAIETVRAIRWG